jgi:hypothetical protein
MCGCLVGCDLRPKEAARGWVGSAADSRILGCVEVAGLRGLGLLCVVGSGGEGGNLGVSPVLPTPPFLCSPSTSHSHCSPCHRADVVCILATVAGAVISRPRNIPAGNSYYSSSFASCQAPYGRAYCHRTWKYSIKPPLNYKVRLQQSDPGYSIRF